MARKLKTYTTSIGFYDLAVAAPSMKAALEAWGSGQNLFHQGLAQETEDADIVSAALEKPGVVLRRAVGTDRPYQEHAAPPDAHAALTAKPKPAAKKPVRKKRAAKAPGVSHQAAILSFEQARAKREALRRQEDAARAKQEAAQARKDEKRHRQQAKAKEVLEQAQKHHAQTVQRLEKQRQAIDGQLEAEMGRWHREEKRLAGKIAEADP